MENKKLDIDAVLFDMDGLILDTEKIYNKCWIEAARYYGFDMSFSEQLLLRSNSPKYAAPLLKELYGPECDYFKIKARRQKIMADYYKTHEIEKKPYVEELLTYLKGKGIKAAVATATGLDRTEEYLKRVDLFDKFDKIISCSMVENGKPDPDVYLYACKEVGVDTDRCLALEDSPNGCLSAYRAGVPVIMVPDLSEPDEKTRSIVYAVVKNLRAVEEYI